MDEGSSIVKEVRDRAMKISERFGHDPRRYLEHLKELENRECDRVVGQITVVGAARKQE